MRGIVKGFVVGILGLAVLFGSPALSFARAKKPIIAQLGCICACQYECPFETPSGTCQEFQGWLDDGNEGQNCGYFNERQWTCETSGKSGKLVNCRTASKPAGKVSGSGAVQRPQGGVIGPVTPSQPRVAPSQAPGGSIQK